MGASVVEHPLLTLKRRAVGPELETVLTGDSQPLPRFEQVVSVTEERSLEAEAGSATLPPSRKFFAH